MTYLIAANQSNAIGGCQVCVMPKATNATPSKTMGKDAKQ